MRLETKEEYIQRIASKGGKASAKKLKETFKGEDLKEEMRRRVNKRYENTNLKRETKDKQC